MSKISVKLKLFSKNSIFRSCQTRGFYEKWFLERFIANSNVAYMHFLSSRIYNGSKVLTVKPMICHLGFA